MKARRNDDGHGRRPLLVTAGFSPVPVIWRHVVWYYRNRGFRARTLPFRLADMRDTTTYARHIADDVRARADGGRVHIVGLSMGGVAALYAIKRLGLADAVDAFVSVGSPFHGSPVSYLGLPSLIFTKVGEQLRHGSDFLRDLCEDPLPAGPTYIALSGTKDHICPVPTAFLSDARNITVEFGHKDLLLSRDLHCHIADIISSL